MFLTSRLDL